MTAADKTTKPEAEKKTPVVSKYTGPNFIPGVPARDLTEEDFADFDAPTMELLRQDAEREGGGNFKHSKALGPSEHKKTEKAAKANSEKES